MGILSNIGDAIKKTGKKGLHAIVDKKDQKYIKKKILNRFEYKHLKSICREYACEPSPYEEDPFTGKRRRIHLDKYDYIGKVMWNVKLEDVKAFASKKRIPISDILKEEKELKKTREQQRQPDSSELSQSEIPYNTFDHVIEMIEQFEPSRIYRDEYGYHTELQGWLKAHFSNAIVEHQIGSSRPDIVIDDSIAIEVKGPTRRQDLTTVADKCNRYMLHFENLAVVLFEVDVWDRFYDEWLRGINERYPEVVIIRK
jgi:hypothetical protein